MWKIESLYLKNFAPVYSGMDREEIRLDLSETDTKINIFIGKMGSGKSAILGHLQPFSSYGTLDIRNQNDLILPNKEGIKEIIFTNGFNKYSILHIYSWNKSNKSHSTKSFIKKNNVELNENGNVRSFKEIIKTEFGLDQNFLRLLRLGSNVTNIINMKSTERKSFISSLLEDNEIYATLHSKISEEYREYNAGLSLLSNKLSSFSSDQERYLTTEREELSFSLNNAISEKNKLEADMYTLIGINLTLDLNNALDDDISSTAGRISLLTNEKIKLEDKLKNMDDVDANTLSIEFGKLSEKLISSKENLINLESNQDRLNKEYIKLEEYINVYTNDAHRKEILDRFNHIKDQYLSIKTKAIEYNYSYDYTTLVNLVDSINLFNLSLQEICLVDKDILITLFRSDSSILNTSRKKLQILHNIYDSTKKSINNIDFAREYELNVPLFRPPNCPSKSCPFIDTHPAIIKINDNNKPGNKIILIDKLQSIQNDINKFDDYVTYYPRLEVLRKYWGSINKILSDIGALYDDVTLYNLLTNSITRTNWYDHNRLLTITEQALASKRFIDIENKYIKTESELNSISDIDIVASEEKLLDIKASRASNLSAIEMLNSDIKDIQERLDNVSCKLSLCNEFDSMTAFINSFNSEISELETKLHSLKEDKVKVKANNGIIISNREEISAIKKKCDIYTDRISQISTYLNDMLSTKSSYEELLIRKDNMSLILDAISTKEGIPLIIVQHFLMECKDIVNNLIYDIFDDSLEILDFDIKEDTNEFKIPFSRNGNIISDIEYASQGEKAIITIALSFAMSRRSGFDYNIHLLDEIDNSIHKSDRDKFISIIFKHMKDKDIRQLFLITHNDIFQHLAIPINVIMTTDELVDNTLHNQIKLF